MKVLKILACAAACLASQAMASDASGGYITNILSTSNGAVLFNVSGSRTATLPCQTGGAQRFAIDASNANGKNLVSVLLVAYSQHKPIYVHGLGSCTIWPDTETAAYINTLD